MQKAIWKWRETRVVPQYRDKKVWWSLLVDIRIDLGSDHVFREVWYSPIFCWAGAKSFTRYSIGLSRWILEKPYEMIIDNEASLSLQEEISPSEDKEQRILTPKSRYPMVQSNVGVTRVATRRVTLFSIAVHHVLNSLLFPIGAPLQHSSHHVMMSWP